MILFESVSHLHSVSTNFGVETASKSSFELVLGCIRDFNFKIFYEILELEVGSKSIGFHQKIFFLVYENFSGLKNQFFGDFIPHLPIVLVINYLELEGSG